MAAMGRGNDADRHPSTAHGQRVADGGISPPCGDAGPDRLLELSRGGRGEGRPGNRGRRASTNTVRGAPPDGTRAFRDGDGAGPGYPGGAHYRQLLVGHRMTLGLTM